ncbi:unannotated protein [freshwater metagenome]|uniref:Unannotated protein n=1 Tax=freshwater metagenome TaxID=449393 RepID=A0A6J7QVD6_9ZZZZ
MSTRSRAMSKWTARTASSPPRTANSAASFTRLARSAPLMPGVPRATTLRSTSGPRRLLLTWTLRISMRSSSSGRGTTTWRSKRPGRNSAGSRMSGRLVAAIMTMPSVASKPSISESIWLSVCSRSSWPPPTPAPRLRPMESISSTKMMARPSLRALSNRSRTRDAPTPTNISMKSEPVTDKKGTSASPATARAMRVLPVPGGPTSRMPLGVRAPIDANLSGKRRKSTTSRTSCLTPAYPATSAKVVPGRSVE